MTSAGRALLLAGLLVLGSAAAGCSSSPDTSAPTTAEITALLARHAAAVSRHDQAAFDADLDPAGPAKAFREGQDAAFANLAKVPLASWAYTLAGRTDDRESEAAAAKRYGRGTVVMHLTLQYELRGIDRTPVSKDLWWTFVRNGGRVVLAGDDALAGVGGASWQGPWDFGPLAVVRGRSSLVLGHPTAGDATLRDIAATVDLAVPAVTGVWGRDWSRQVAVVVPATADELTAQTGQSSSITTQVAAVAIFDGPDAVTGAVTGERLLVNPDALARLSAIGRRITVQHEIAHLAAAPSTTDVSPRWLIEGFADYVGNLGSGQPVTTTASELRADVRAGRLPAGLPVAAAFDTGDGAPQAYEESWLACRLIAARAGVAGLVRFYRLVGASSGDADAAVAGALRQVLHQTPAQFVATWRAYVKAELG